MTEEVSIKIVAVGDKISLKNEFLWTYINRKYDAKITDEFDHQSVKIPNKNLRLELWNAPSSDRVRSLLYPKTDIFILFFNAMNRSSFDNMRKIYLPELKQNAAKVPIILVSTNTEPRDQEDAKKKEVKDDNKKKEGPVSTKEALYVKAENLEIFQYKEPDLKVKSDVDEIIYLAVENYLSSHSKKSKGLLESIFGTH